MVYIYGGIILDKRSFSNIIGYDRVKEELSIIGDMFNNPTKYEQIGAEVPKGILFSGEPGIGKTTFAYSFMEASGVNTYIIRRNKDTVAFLDEIRDTFQKAKENSPSIILLDDMDKFNKDKTSFEEFSVVQSSIDLVEKSKVLIIATVNDIDKIPASLLRSGRFDRIINMSIGAVDSQLGNHWKYFLKDKEISIDVPEEDINKLFFKESPSKIKTIINDILIQLAYKNEKIITKDVLIKAYLRTQQKEYLSSEIIDENELIKTAYHEAGHVVVVETLKPRSVSFATAVGTLVDNPGFVKWCDFERNPELSLYIALAGKIAEERFTGKTSFGASSDLEMLQAKMDILLSQGFYGVEFMGDLRSHNKLREDMQLKKIEVIEKINREVTDIITSNWNLVDRVAKELVKQETLLSSDIRKIIETA